MPRTTGPFPAVILIHGSSALDRDETILGHKPFLVLSDHFTRHGIAVLRFDKRGVGKSTGNYDNATIEDFCDDVSKGVEYLKSRPKIIENQIESVKKELGRRGIPFLGFLYIPKDLDPINEKIAELQYETIINQPPIQIKASVLRLKPFVFSDLCIKNLIKNFHCIKLNYAVFTH